MHDRIHGEHWVRRLTAGNSLVAEAMAGVEGARANAIVPVTSSA